MSAEDDGEVNHRPNTRLEVDHPEHCKDCGAELPTGPMDVNDADGRPLIWSSKLAEFVTIETCPECWAEDQLDALVRECNDRYAGRVPEVLADAVE